MTLLKAQTVLICSFILVSTLCGSCTKDRDECPSNCKEILIAGRVVDSSVNKGLKGIGISVYWQDAGMCYICPEMVVGSGRTDENGNFSFRVKVDSTMFGGHALHASIKVPNGYISSMDYSDEKIDYSRSYYSAPFFSTIRFRLYQKANLTIRLNKTSTLPFLNFSLKYRYDHTSFGLYTTQDINALQTHDFKVVTAANVFTKVQSSKAIAIGVFEERTDSVKCSAPGPNLIEVNY